MDWSVPEELWQKKSKEWQLELLQLRETLTHHQGAKRTFYEQGFALLVLGKREAERKQGEGSADSPALEKWWSQVDTFRTFLAGSGPQTTLLLEDFKELAAFSG